MSIVRRAVALAGLVALLALASTGAAGTALAAPPTTLRATLTPGVVVYPGTAVVAGSISVSGAGVSLFARPAGAADWSPAGIATAAAGVFRFSFTPSVTTDLRVEYLGDAEHAPASLDLRLVLKPRVTTAFPREPWLGRAVRLSGAVAPALPGAAVSIERRVGDLWQPLATTTLGGDSRFVLRWQPADFGYYRLRARVAADAAHGDGASRGVQVTVNRPNLHHVLYEYAHYIVIVRHLYKLYYYEHGVLVRSFKVALGRPGYPTPLGRFRIRHKRRPGGGPLGACVMYYHGSIAIHGTNEAYLLSRFPRNFSHGCARMYNNQALWLYRHCPVGTKVHNLR